MSNKVVFGLSNVHVAFLDEDTMVYETPVSTPGSVKLSLSPEGESAEFYADNIKYFSADANNGYKGDLEVALMPDAVLAEMLGWEVDTSGMLVEIADGTQKPFALLFEVEGDAAQKRYVYYNCLAARPNAEHGTKGKSVEPNTQTVSLTVSPVEIDDVLIVKGGIERTLANAAVYDAWYTDVVTPTYAAVS